MKKILSLLAVGLMLSMPAHAWEFTGLGSLNPFTNFGRGFGGDCGCQRPQLTKCEKLNGVTYGRASGYAAPITLTPSCAIDPMPVVIDNCPNCPIIQHNPCPTCHRAF